MAGPLNHSPADITSRVLIGLGIGADPDNEDEDEESEITGAIGWPIRPSNEVDNPDNVITVYNTAGVLHGRIHIDGEVQQHYGIQVKVRCRDEAVGFSKADEIKIALDETVYDEEVEIDGSFYLVHSYNRTSDVLFIGNDPNRETVSFTINATVCIRMRS